MLFYHDDGRSIIYDIDLYLTDIIENIGVGMLVAMNFCNEKKEGLAGS